MLVSIDFLLYLTTFFFHSLYEYRETELADERGRAGVCLITLVVCIMKSDLQFFSEISKDRDSVVTLTLQFFIVNDLIKMFFSY